MINLQKINMTHEFRQVCDIFNLTPEEIIQDFINNVSIAEYLCDPFAPNRWANTFVLEYVIAQVESEDIMVKYDEFVEKLITSVLSNPREAKTIGREMVNEWHKAVLEDRIKDMMDDQDAEENNEL
jgi:hypothetical protein